MIVTPANAGAWFFLAPNLTNFAAGLTLPGTSEGTDGGRPLSPVRAALHDRPNNGTDLSRFPDFAPVHPSEVDHD